MQLHLLPTGLLAASLLAAPACAAPIARPEPGFRDSVRNYWNILTSPIRAVLGDYKLALGSPDNDMNLLHEPNWMSRQPDNLPVTSITIPGTHDTMSYSPALGPIGQTQSHNLTTQYEAGIRYIDIRCRHIGNRFQIVHNILPTGHTFSTVLEITGKFLKKHSDETIIMRLKDESYAKPEELGLDPSALGNLVARDFPIVRSRSADPRLESVLEDDEEDEVVLLGPRGRDDLSLDKRIVNSRSFAETLDWYRHSHKGTREIMAKHMYTIRHKLNRQGNWETVIPTLGQLRGKFLILTEFDKARPDMGIPWYSPDKIDLEDDWLVPNAGAMANKWQAIETHLDKAHTTIPDAQGKRKLFLTHLSGNSPRVWARIVALGGENGLGAAGMGMNERTMDKLAKWLLEDQVHPGGVVITDFAGKGLINSIIALNSKREREKIPKWKQWINKVKGWLKGIFDR